MTRPLVLRSSFWSDVDDASAWYEDRRYLLGEEFEEEVIALLERIQARPGSNPVWRELIRRVRLQRFRHSVFFALEEDRIEILGIVHGKREVNRWLRLAWTMDEPLHPVDLAASWCNFPARPETGVRLIASLGWRNWQTRRLQVPVPARVWGFKSPPQHHVSGPAFRRGAFLWLRATTCQ